MKQISKGRYAVDSGEPVHIELSPRGIGPQFIVAALDGQQISFTDGPNPKYTFTVYKPHHFLLLRAIFDGAPPDAEVEVEITGSDGTKHSGPTLDKDNEEIAIDFRTL